MKWQGRRRSPNVKDYRGRSSGGGMNTNLLLGLLTMFFRGGLTKTKIFILLVVIAIFIFIGNPFNLLNTSAGISSNQPAAQPAEKDELYQFVEVVIADTEDVWNKLFSEHGADYTEPQLIVFDGIVRSACGGASSASGPFYCPADQSAYIDLSFYRALSQRFGAPGDFAMAYVIAHEVGHHVQNLMGTSDQVQEARSRLSQEEYNGLSVRLELQADFYAGVWAHHAQKMHQILEPGDVQEALTAASAIGDDKLQKQSQGYVAPESFTHGTSKQRVRWFKKGFETGDISQGDTFSSEQL